ncbi:MAG: biotin-dependent carboxyltransferase family protein [Clostridia bacterium]|nr:biotin-dependent carboxyltransferase family protein [Clostridia bacterium]
MIRITDGGSYTLPVTARRHFLEPMGMPTGGPMDRVRALLANRLIDAPDDAALLEAAFALPGMVFTSPAAIAVTGGAEAVKLIRKGKEISFPCGETIYVEAGDELVSAPIERGMRAYIAFSGGLELDGVRQKPVKKGDSLSCGEARLPSPKKLAYDPLPYPEGRAVLRVIEGVQSDHFSREGVGAFFGGEYAYTPQSDRMGIRLSGPSVGFGEGRDGNIISEGMMPGDIQIPPNGQPIIMTADCQTTGGYAKIAHVIEADLPLAAQLRPGDKLMFRRVLVADAHIAMRKLLMKIDGAVENEKTV